jgi:light-regulated signal transduction histidine kinase (bacteriophytochrome)
MIMDSGVSFNSIWKGLVNEMETNIFEFENGKRSFASSPIREGLESIQSKLHFLSNERNSPFLTSFFIELIERIRNTLNSIRNYTQLSRGKFSDKEFGEYFYRAVTEDVEKMDMVLNGLVNYIKLNTPMRKMDTVHRLIEEELKKHQAKLEQKGIKLFKKFEKELPETIVPDEQLRYVLSSVFQYVLANISPNLSMGLYTRSFVLEKEMGQGPSLFQKDGRYIEISVIFMGYKKPAEQEVGTPTLKEEPLELILRFVKEVVQRNQGTMRVEGDEKKAKTLISLKFPVERRKVVYYQALN